MIARTLYDKVWDQHVVKTYDDGSALLYIDRHLVQEVSSPHGAFAALIDEGRSLRRPARGHIAVADHAVPTRFRAPAACRKVWRRSRSPALSKTARASASTTSP